MWILRHWSWLVPVVLAFCVRLFNLLRFRELPYYRLPFGDAKTFVIEAERLRTDGFFGGREPFFQGPLYPAFLAILTALGLPVTAAFWIQCATGVVTVACVYGIARALRGTRAGFIAALLYALYDGAVFFDADLLAASLTTTLVVLGLCLWMLAERTPSAPRSRPSLAMSAVAFGLIVWGRANLILPIAALGVLTLRRFTGTKARAAFFLPLLVVVALPCIRNSRITGEPTFVATSGGVNFFIGNHAGASGLFDIPPESGLSNERELDAVSRLAASRLVGRELTATEASREWLRRGVSEWKKHPTDLARTTLRKVALLAAPLEIPNHLDIALLREQSPLLSVLPVRAWLLVPLGAAGLFFLRRTRSASPIVWFVLLGAASVVPFFVTARYRLFAMPLLAVGAGILVDAFRTRSASPRALAPAALCGAGLLVAGIVASPPDAPPAVALTNLGALHLDLGEPAEAEAAFRRALRTDPTDSRALENLAILALDRGDTAEALELADRVIASDPRAHSAWNLRGAILGQLGRFDDAIAAFERCLSLAPHDTDAAYNLDRTWTTYLATARALLEREGLSPDEEDPDAIERARAALRQQGYDRAADRLQSPHP